MPCPDVRGWLTEPPCTLTPVRHHRPRQNHFPLTVLMGWVRAPRAHQLTPTPFSGTFSFSVMSLWSHRKLRLPQALPQTRVASTPTATLRAPGGRLFPGPFAGKQAPELLCRSGRYFRPWGSACGGGATTTAHPST